MSSIPPLSTLPARPRGPRLRGRRGAPRGSGAIDDGPAAADVAQSRDHTAEEVERSRDQIIQQTDGDASSSRMSAVSLRYFEDPYAHAFFPPNQEVPKRYPLINRGTYVRTSAIDRLVTRFLETELRERKQVVSLGAGSDTRFFRLCAGKHNVTYHELDFESNVIPKRAAIRSSPQLSRMILPQQAGSSFHLHAIDLRVLTNKSPPTIPDLDESLPTLLISECCLCYLPPDAASSVVQYFTMNLKASLAMVLYEPVRPYDAFGKTMVSNLGSRGIELRTLKRYYSLDAQRQRLKVLGFRDSQGARDIHQIWRDSEWVSAAERARIEKAEWLDEVEEWQLLASHYCVAWGWRGHVFSTAWGGIDGSRTGEEQKDDDMM